jgi:hypothetical protein
MDDQKVIASPQMSYAFMHIAVHNNEIYGNIVGLPARQRGRAAINSRAAEPDVKDEVDV